MISAKMGRYSYSGRQEADSLKKIQIWWLNKNGYLVSGWISGTIKWTNGWTGKETSVGIQSGIKGSNDYIRIWYTQTNLNDEKKDFDYEIPLTTTPCYFGGVRYWFKCPWYSNGVYCGRRVGVLYLGGDYFACRHCYGLTYNSRNLSGWSKLAGQVISIPELEKLKLNVKKKFYKGKTTRSFNRFLKKEQKSFRQLQIMAFGLERKRRLLT